MDCNTVLALIIDYEPAGGARKRKRSSTSQATGFAQRNRSSTRHGTASVPSDAMSIDDLLRLLPSRGRHRRQRLYKRKLNGARDRTTGAAQQQTVLVQRHNRSGRATRKDALIQTGGNVCQVKGKSEWRRWTPEAIQRAAFSRGSVRSLAESMKDTRNPTASGKTAHASLTYSKEAVAKTILDGTARGLRRISAGSRVNPLKFWITGHVADETKLWYILNGYGYRKFSTLSHHRRSLGVTWTVSMMRTSSDHLVQCQGIQPPCSIIF